MIVETTTSRILDALTFSEMSAIKAISTKMEDDKNAILVASSIADNAKITRSVIVSALTKLGAAGVIETRSLGMKGAAIRVINREAFDTIIKGLD